MLNFIKSVYRVLVEIVLWIIPFACAYAGGDLGAAVKESGGGDHRFLGVFIGLVVGILIDVLVGGLIATFLNIDKNIEYLIVGSEGSYGKTNNNKSTGDSETDEVIAYWERESKAKNRGGSSS